LVSNLDMDNLQRLATSSLLLALCIGPLACASGGNTGGRGWRNQLPQLYPNAHYQRIGAEQARMDIDNCMYRADQGAPRESVAKDAAINTLGGAAAGAALGAIGGAIAGKPGTGAAIGAATGGTLGAGKTVYDKSKPAETYKGYVEACLRERGYDVIGWQ
jgi:hypothetical protein